MLEDCAAAQAAAVFVPAAADGSSTSASTNRKIGQKHKQTESSSSAGAAAAAASSSSSSQASKKARQEVEGIQRTVPSSASVAAASAAAPFAAASSSSSAAAAASPPTSASVSSSSAQPAIALVPFSFVPQPTQERAGRWELIAEQLEAAFHAAIPLLKYSLYGPTLFVDNHPPAMRRLFTAHLIDECMLAAGLTPLPLVLCELIGDYHACELPLREDKAREQMGRTGFPLQHPDPAEATYEGQLDCAVDRADYADAHLNEQFPVANLAVAQDEGEESVDEDGDEKESD